ncbi:CheR family methyltransferase [Zhongshania sp.]|jgi:hypothetical protein|uniref:CheR family methyltransferase n=1 Tax=Zhongshania sp. TaxID=1971902 RepID=UPI0039E664E7
MSIKKPTPLRLRPTVGDAIGTTAFFRNRVLNETLLNELLISGRKHYSILFHACSIGAEVYSFLIQYLAGGFNEHFSLSCYATDKQQDFVTYADHAQFPQEILQGCTEAERQYFTVHDGTVSLESRVKKNVEFLPAADFANFDSERSYDVVVLLNALVYVTAEMQAEVFDRVSSYNLGWIVSSGFHQATIKKDLQRNGYSPVETAMEEIHMSWSDRLREKPVPQEALPPNIFTDWSLPAFSEVPDYRYRYCALFSKDGSLNV